MFAKTGRLLFSMYGFGSYCPEKFQANTSKVYVEKVVVQKPLIGFWTVTSDHKVNKYSADLLLLIKIIIWDGFC